MTNFNYKQFHTEVEQLTQKANWYRQAGNRAAMMELRRNPCVTLPTVPGRRFLRRSFWQVFHDSCLPRLLSMDTQRANEAAKWYQENMRWYKNEPKVTTTEIF